MKLRCLTTTIALLALTAFVAGCAGEPAPEPVADDDLGLNKESVFSTPDPIVAASTAKDPGENEAIGAYFSESPPAISHLVTDFLPIRRDENLCMECHDLFDEIGQDREPGDPTPMPATHYTDMRGDRNEVTGSVVGARFVCTQCHAPQADAQPLVANTYQQ